MAGSTAVAGVVARVKWFSGIVWIFSWRTIYLEVFRWQHLTTSLRFVPGPPLPGTDIAPRPAMPLRAVRLGSFAAPAVFLATWFIERRQQRTTAGVRR